MSGYPSIELPEELSDCQILASVSGGKDSTALMLALREARIPYRAVFADTGWEHDDVYRYLDVLRERVGPIDTVRADVPDPDQTAADLVDLGMKPAMAERLSPSAMVARMLYRAGFPARVQRWCTRELKIEPIMAYAGALENDGGRPVANAVGVRADESAKRRKLLSGERGGELEREAEGPNGWGAWVWRPLIRWSVDDVLRIHIAHGVPVNPLYQRGHDRVGCWPCIHSSKEEVRLLANSDPERVEMIAELEMCITELRRRRNAEMPFEWLPCQCTSPRPTGRYFVDDDEEERAEFEDDEQVAMRVSTCHECGGSGEVWASKPRYTWPEATFFLGRQTGPLPVAPSIHDVVAWSRTSRGGRQLQLLDNEPHGGCMRWGLCDVPTGEGDHHG